jgi:hypothetical protein
MEYRYCKRLNGTYEGFIVDIKQDILKLESFIDLLENKIKLNNLKDVEKDFFINNIQLNQLNIQLNMNYK